MKHLLMIKIAFFLAVAAVLVFAPAPVSAVTQIFETQVSASESDAEEDIAGAVNLTDATLDLGGLYRKVGLRFANITLQKNAPITRAYIEFTTAGQDSANTTFTIEAVAQDNPGVFTTGTFNVSTRPVYIEAVDWVMNYAWLATDEVHQSADITALVQKLVDRSGWASGNAMAFVISNGEDVFRKATSWNADPAKAPKLHIEYAVNVVEVRVSASTDDVHQSSIPPNTVTNGSDVILSYGTYTLSGFRFQNVNIPQGAVINSACLKFVAKADYAASTGYMRLMGEKRINPPTFSLVATNADSVYKRYMTSSLRGSYVQWANTAAWTAGTEYISADIKNIIQEQVGQAGWETSNKSLAMWFYYSTGVSSQQRKVWSFDGDSTKAALLHIEYGQSPVGAGTDPPVISLSNTELGRSTFEGSTAASQHFSLMNSGATALNYTRTITYNKGSNWLTLGPSDESGSLGPGEEQNFSVNFDTTGLIAGTYDAIIKFTDANAANSPQEVKVSLAVMPQGAIQCGDIPLYTQNIASPAVMILLDLSGSMTWEIDLIPQNYDFTNSTTPNIGSVVQEIVNRNGWVSGNAITFIIDKVSGTGYRVPRMYDNYSPSAALLHVEYDDGSGSKIIETKVKSGTDDAASISAGFSTNWAASSNKLAASAIAFRFQNLTIPKNATISNAYIRFVPYQTLSDPITVKVSAHASDNSPTFPSMGGALELTTTTRPRTSAGATWDVPPWTAVTIERKIDVAKTVIGELVKDTGISWGFGSWANDSTDHYTSLIDYTKIHAGCNAHTAEHQTKLQAAVAGLNTYSSTPYAPSMDGGRKYFNKEKAEWDPILNAEAGIKFQDASCQPKFLIEVSDGMGNVPSTSDVGLYNEAYATWYKNLVADKANALADTGVSAIGVGFGIPEGEEEQIFTLAEVANTRGKADTSDSLYAMHQEDATGKGLPYLATNKDELMNVFRTIMNSVKGAVFFGSAPAATTSTDLGDMVVLASFNAGNWTGDIEAITKDTTTGKWSTSLWKASENTPLNRSVWTVDSGNNLIAYTDSTLAGDNYLCKKIGDIVHSTPVVVGAPPYFYAFDSYASFKRNLSVASPREKMAYVGSNDGLLHAFSLETGQERWAFLPKSLQAKLNEAGNGASYDPCSTSYCHRYLLDGSPQVADVYGFFGGANKWRTLLVVGQRGGGTAYTALDVTKGESFGAGADQAKFLWELSDAEMGESWSEAAIERVSYPGGGAGAAAWGVFVSSGYHENDNLQSTKEGYLYGVEAATGNGLWSDGTNAINKIKLISESGTLNYTNNNDGNFQAGELVRGGTSGAYAVMDACISSGNFGQMFLSNIQGTFVSGEALIGNLGHTAVVNGTLTVVAAGQKNNALSSPVTGNFNFQDHIEDCIYVGDLYGTMHRVDSIGKGQTPSASKLFKFNPYPLGPDERPIRGKASIAYKEGGSGLWVYYGTGRYETAGDKVNNQQQYFFGLKDTPTPRATPYSLADLATLEARFTTATIGGKTLRVRTINGSNASGNPWAMKLFAGQSGWGGPATIGGSERVFTKPLVVGGIVFFTTFIPDADICTGSGDTYVFALDYKTGLPPSTPVFDLNGDGKFTDADKVPDVNGNLVMPIGVYVGRGQGSAPVLFKDTLFITTSTPQAGTGGSGNVTGLNALLVNIPQQKIRVESWKHN